ncbi:hypothetical protein E6C48_05875 [Mesorhizobium composti]|uniref:Maturase K n=1 Tax=Ollibium composti TaxID=2675109 RepID=A0ABY2Q8H8_9HYPH|nr:hypothetical protein E6C48_05875 [Mesorhizobium composti]
MFLRHFNLLEVSLFYELADFVPSLDVAKIYFLLISAFNYKFHIVVVGPAGEQVVNDKIIHTGF